MIDIRGNRHLQLTAAAADMLLGMPRLQLLLLAKGQGGGKWTDESLHRVISLITAHRALHPGRRRLKVITYERHIQPE